MEGAPKIDGLADETGLGSGSTIGAAAGTAVLGPGIGTAVGGVVGSLFKSGSPRYEGGPLLSSVQQRLAALKAGDATAIAQSKADAQNGGPGWRDVALVLAPVVRPDLFGSPSRPLNSDDYTALGPYATNVAGAAPTRGMPNVSAASLLGGSGSMSTTTLLLAGLGVFALTKMFPTHKRNPRHRRRGRR